MTNLKSFMMSLAATTVSIVLTFGTTAIVSYDKLYHFSSANYPFYSHTDLLRMNDSFEQCKLMMKVKDKDLEAYSIKQQKLQAKTSGESQEYETLLRDMRQRNDRLQNAREEAAKAR